MGSMALYDLTDGVATVTMNRPERLNTMTDEFLEDLLVNVEKAADDEEARVVVLAGAGRAFCAGGDLSAGVGGGVGGDGPLSPTTTRVRRFMRTAQLLHEMPKPTIAAVRGACAGAGLSLACAADLRFAGKSAVFATAFLAAGVPGDFGGTWTLPRVIGDARARAAFLLNERISADDALGIGLVTAVLEDEALDVHVAAVAQKLASGPQTALRLMKANLNDSLHSTFAESLEYEAKRHVLCTRTDDAIEATQAFLAKRPPVFAQ